MAIRQGGLRVLFQNETACFELKQPLPPPHRRCCVTPMLNGHMAMARSLLFSIADIQCQAGQAGGTRRFPRIADQ
jgi:hypothetical protein